MSSASLAGACTCANALLIVPPATARKFSKSPEQMAGLAILAGLISVGLGLWASLVFDTPAGPSVVLASGVLFSLSLLKPAS